MSLKQTEKEKFMQQILEAAKDPLFMEDLIDSMKAFENYDIQSLREITEW